MGAIAEKYHPDAISAHATIGKAPHNQFTCDIVAQIMKGLMLRAEGRAGDAHQAFDQAAEKIEKQLRRYMRRLNDHHVQAQFAARQEEALYRVFESDDDDDEAASEDAAPPIIAETATDIPEVSVSNAVMIMDFRDAQAILFKNAGTGRAQHGVQARGRHHRLGRTQRVSDRTPGALRGLGGCRHPFRFDNAPAEPAPAPSPMRCLRRSAAVAANAVPKGPPLP